MLSVFPELLFLAPFAPFLVRLTLACVLAFAAWTHASRADGASRTLAALEAGLALALAAGAWTQPSAILALVVGAIWAFQPSSRTYPLSTILLSLVLALTLVITGAGALAFDLPL